MVETKAEDQGVGRSPRSGRTGLVALVAMQLVFALAVLGGVAPRDDAGVSLAYLLVLSWAVLTAVAASVVWLGRFGLLVQAALLVLRLLTYWSLVLSHRDAPMNPYRLLGPPPWVILVAEAVLVGLVLWRVTPGRSVPARLRLGSAGAAALLLTVLAVVVPWSVGPQAADIRPGVGGAGVEVEIWDFTFGGNGGADRCGVYQVEPVLPGLVRREESSLIGC
ncbi:MAG: hypothetical protein AAF547_00440 [Actinomycetota bacterium]